MTAACFVLARRFASDPRWRGWASFSILAGATVAVSFVARSILVSLDFTDVLPGGPSGFFERVSLAAGGAWIPLLAFRLSREKKLLGPYTSPTPGR
jgi:hypothetical protein